MENFKNLINLICDWDNYVNQLESQQMMAEGTADQLCDFMNNLYTCASIIMIHGTPEQSMQFVQDMSKWGDIAEQLKEKLHTDQTTEDSSNESSNQ